MTPELPKNTGQSPENPLGQHEARFRQLETEIKTSLGPAKSLIIVMTNSEDREDGINLSINSVGTWLLSTELDYPIFTNSSKELLGVVKKYAFVVAYNDEVFKKLREDAHEGKINADEYLKRYPEARRSLNRSTEENPVPFAEELLGHMAQALQGYKKNPH